MRLLVQLILLAVTVFMLLLMVLPRLGRGDGRPIREIQADLEAYRAALESYRAKFGGYPFSLQVLRNMSPSMGGCRTVWPSSLDPFGHPYQYRVPRRGDGLEKSLWSLGPDGMDGTEDDIYLPHRHD